MSWTRLKSLLQKLPKILDVFIVSLGVLYPFAVFFGLHYFPPFAIGCALLALLALRILRSRHKPVIERGVLAFGFCCVFALLWFNQLLAVMAYPLIISVGLACAFAYTLWFPPSMIERFARRYEPNLDEGGVKYTRKVTIAWIVFFVCNAGISTATALSGSLQVWTLYNGFVSYLLIATMFVGEWIIRRFVRGTREDQI